MTRFFSFLCSVYRPSESSSSVVVPSLDPQATSRPCSCTRKLCKGTSHTCHGQGQNIRVHVTMGIMGKRTNTFHLGCMKYNLKKNLHLPYKQHYSKNSSQNKAMILLAPLCGCSIPQLNALGVTWFIYDICNCTLTNAFQRVRGLCA